MQTLRSCRGGNCSLRVCRRCWRVEARWTNQRSEGVLGLCRRGSSRRRDKAAGVWKAWPVYIMVRASGVLKAEVLTNVVFVQA